MTFTGNEPHDIPLPEAARMTKKYRSSIHEGDTIAHYFGKRDIKALLKQDHCVGMRVYYGLDENGAKQLIITGVDENGNDLFNGLLAERSVKCPLHCGAANPLNS
jgi:hypothetical protein